MTVPYMIQVLLASLLFVTVLARTRYDGHQVFRVTPKTDQHLQHLHELSRSEPTLDFWKSPTAVDSPVDILLEPEHIPHMTRAFRSHGIPHSVIIPDLQRLLDQHDQLNQSQDRTGKVFDRYMDHDEIQAFMDTKNEDCGSDRCSIFVTGTSFEGHTLRGIKITNGSGSNKPAIWVDAGIHAREWIAHATGCYIIERLVDDYDSDPIIQALLDHFDWYIYPMVNPDGYIYSWDEDRMWRKTRSVNASSTCVGADANRNYDFQWLTVGASDDPCSITFAGYFPFSEPETRAHADFMYDSGADWQVFITLHSYSQLWMTPWGYTYDLPEDYDDLIDAGLVAVDALTAVHGTSYKLGCTSCILYRSSGTSRDWAKGVPQIKYVYTLELRDTGEHGFVLPPAQILPTGEETWAGIKAMAEYIRNLT